MKSRFVLSFIAIAALAVIPTAILVSSAQDAPQTRSSKVRKLTGCIGKGATETDFNLDTADGSTWKLKSDAVDFSKHVGQTVTVTGTVDHARFHALKEKTKGVAKSSTPEHGTLTVTTIKRVSKSCKVKR
jgi:hypothetical protein